MNKDGTNSVWVALNEKELLWEQFEDEFLVFSERSGETHFLNLTAAEVLIRLQAGPGTLSEVVADLCEAFDMEENPVLAEQIAAVIKGFEHEGLVCRCPG